MTHKALTNARRDYDRIARAIDVVIGDRSRSLEALADEVGLSPFHFQRLFKRWAGVTPKQFATYLTLEHAKVVLEKSDSLLGASFETGLSGPSRLHDAFVTLEAMTPGAYKAQGRDLVIRYGFHPTRFGDALILRTERGICGLEFFSGTSRAALAAAKARWPLSRFVEEIRATAPIAAQLGNPDVSTPLLLRGTNFQLQVWAALLRIPPGSIASYGDIAAAIGQPTASRAVGAALGQNTIGFLVPCHRVLRATGLFQSYRWGATRRRAMLAWEASQLADAPSASGGSTGTGQHREADQRRDDERHTHKKRRARSEMREHCT
jgi:AraC family transcriptional regulator of adaptative response/methylated-DNA-[protein]-cysteine methyltransferase